MHCAIVNRLAVRPFSVRVSACLIALHNRACFVHRHDNVSSFH